MKMQTPFVRLPIRLDTARLQHEMAQFSSSDWSAHPTDLRGNSALRLITANGEENDSMFGEMLMTPHLRKCQYIQQVLSAFQCVLSRSRLMRLTPGSVVPEHSDIDYHWFDRVRIHIPIITDPAVRIICDGKEVQMAAGEAWIFDNWRNHSVKNDSPITRVHLVADTAGSPYFWQFVRRGQSDDFGRWRSPPATLPFNPQIKPTLITERFNALPLLPLGEVKTLCTDFLNDIESGVTGDNASVSAAFLRLVESFMLDWAALWRVFGDAPSHFHHYRELLKHTKNQMNALPDTVVMKSTGVGSRLVFTSRVLHYAINEQLIAPVESTAQKRSKMRDIFDRPLFIVAAPRSGSTLLFETLACSSELATIGGESHGIFESIDSLNPAITGGCESNRLTAADVDSTISEKIKRGFVSSLRDRHGRLLNVSDLQRIRLLDKLPKNALRIPFLKAIFPDALFVYLYRNPWQNISSMIEAWKSGKWITYPNLVGAKRPWSLLLPPQWPKLIDEPIEVICAQQWVAANEFILADLNNMSSDNYCVVDYNDITSRPCDVVRHICDFGNIRFDGYLRERIATPLPLSRYTQTPPDADKWKKNEQRIALVQNLFSGSWENIQAFAKRSGIV